MTQVEAAGVPVSVLDRGAGPAVVLVHSAGASAGQWRDLTGALEGRRVLAPDLYGHGRTPPWPGDRAAPGRAFALLDEALLVDAVIDAAGGGPVDLVGHSYGASACAALALLRPGRLRSLALVEPTLFCVLLEAGRGDLWREVDGVVARMAAGVAAGEPREAACAFYDYFTGPGGWERLAEPRREALARLMAATTIPAALAQMTTPDPILPGWRALAVPTLLLAGTVSPRPVLEVSEILARELPRARFERIAGAGHMAPITHPDAVNRAVLAMLRP